MRADRSLLAHAHHQLGQPCLHAAQARQQGLQFVAVARLRRGHGGSEVAFGNAVGHLGRMGQGLQDGARQQPGAGQAQQQAHQRARRQQRDALAFAAGGSGTRFGHTLALVFGQLVHGCGVGVCRRTQLLGNGVGRQGLARLAALDEVVPHRAKTVAGLVDGIEQGLRFRVCRQLVQALAHFGRAGRGGLAVGVDARRVVGVVVDLQQRFGAGGAEHHDGVQLPRQQRALGRRTAQVVRNVLQPGQPPDTHRRRQGHDEADHPKSQGQADSNTCVGDGHGRLS